MRFISFDIVVFERLFSYIIGSRTVIANVLVIYCYFH
jgi:hypothetical protein